MALSCLFGITRCVPQENSDLLPQVKSFIDQNPLVKMAGYCSRSVFEKMNLANIQPSRPYARSISHMYIRSAVTVRAQTI